MSDQESEVAMQLDRPFRSNAETLLARILAASDEVRGMPDVFGRVRQSFLHRCNACIECGGRHFEHIL